MTTLARAKACLLRLTIDAEIHLTTNNRGGARRTFPIVPLPTSWPPVKEEAGRLFCIRENIFTIDV